MALLKAVEGMTGHVSEYHRVVDVAFSLAARTSNVQVATYKDEAARRAGKAPVQSRCYSYSGEEFPFDVATMDAAGENVVSTAYGRLKLHPDFADAVDC